MFINETSYINCDNRLLSPYLDKTPDLAHSSHRATRGGVHVKRALTKVNLLHCLPLILSSFALSPVHAVEKGYIDAVQADLDEFTSGKFEPPPESTWVGSLENQTGGSSNSFNKLKNFSSYVKEKSPGSYIFYAKLPTSYQIRLQQEYLATGDIEQLKRNIFKYSREVKKQKRYAR
jgi:hypothetical protein